MDFVLADLLGSKSAERILLFLLVNGCGYASEVQKTHGIALTPLQSIIRKLEKAGVLTHDVQGKTKLYRLNPFYPLHDELKALLKNAFIHLPAEEKRRLFSRKTSWRVSIKDQYAHQKRTALCLDAFWQRLAAVRRVSIQTESAWHAFGEVSVSEEGKGLILFNEKGRWVHSPHQELDFSNCLRWSLDCAAGVIALEHLRYGPNRPVFLFHLAPISSKTLQSIDSHLCRNDCYFGRIEFTEQHIRFLWRIIGPTKNEILHHTYS
jgi:hypothetical protein